MTKQIKDLGRIDANLGFSMGVDDLKEAQKEARRECLEAILSSSSRLKLIAAGPGTGKTLTFKKVLEKKAGGTNLAMTFIRRLVRDMEKELGDYGEVKTFHGYCKKILHEQNVHSELVPYLTKIITKDAELFGKTLCDFDDKFRSLNEDSPEIEFYLDRGDYYGAVSFDDSVYRLYKMVQSDPNILPLFDQIVIDEFQDFNALEVAFIDQFQSRGPILIVGDDDQAIYDNRCASADYLREKHGSGEYAVFELPFCSRCPEPIVRATNAVIAKARSYGLLAKRISKPYECYLDDKEEDSVMYPNIIVAQCSTAKVLPMYISDEVAKIRPEDIAESQEPDKEYTTVLIVGQRQYLREVAKQLRPTYPKLAYTPSTEVAYGLAEGYEQLLRDEKSNLGWRILVEVFEGRGEQEKIITASEKGVAIVEELDTDFVDKHLEVTAIIRRIQNGEIEESDCRRQLRETIGDHFQEIIEHFIAGEEESDVELDVTKPTILLTSFLGCKGLSGGHVFIVGANNGSIPKDTQNWSDVEISRFVVALTRTRKQCHILSNKWLFGPKDKQGAWIPEFQKSDFISFVPTELIEDRGYMKAANFG